ncbi:UNVERIFIED_CONTAM: glycosyltransferase family 2 protein [Kocuria sp. CPCC 205274]
MLNDEKIRASVIILTKNEARNIATAIKSCSEFAEVIVLDSLSTDGTQDIAENLGARVVNFDWNGKYPKKKEWALTVCNYNWVIYLDADEFFTKNLVDEIRTIICKNNAGGIEVPLEYYWTGRKLEYGHRVSKRIGIHRERGHWPRPADLHVKNMWEVEGHYQPIVRQGPIWRATNPLGHQDMDGLYDYFGRHNRYSDWEAHMLESRDRTSLQSRSRKGRLGAALPCKPVIFFMYAYIFRQGFRDGWPGFDHAMALTFYYWQISAKRREIRSGNQVGDIADC